MNKTFDLHRLGMVVRWSILSEWKGFAGGIIGLGIAIALYCLISLFTIKALGESGYMVAEELYASRVYGFIGGMAFIAFYVLASCIFSNMKTKLKRENFLMLPASNLEKFVARILLTTAGAVVGIFCSLVIGDILQFLFSLFITPGFHASITWAVVKEAALNLFSPTDNWLATIALYFFLLFAHSFATLGGTFYRKLPVLLTACTSIVLCIILGIIVNKLGEAGILNFNLNIDLSRGNTTDICFTATIAIVFLALSAFNYWASYKVFCRMQIICNKWLNL